MDGAEAKESFISERENSTAPDEPIAKIHSTKIKAEVQAPPVPQAQHPDLQAPPAPQAQLPDLQAANQEVIEAFTESTGNLLAGKQDNYAALIAGVRVKAAAEAHSPNLSMRLIMAINDALVEFSGKQFGVITKSSRDERRKAMSVSMDQYIEIVFQSTQDIEMMLVENMQRVCQDCGVTMEKYDQSNQYWAQINPQFSLLSMLMLDKMKLMMEGKTGTTIADALAVFDYQITEYPKLKVQVPNPQLMPMIKQSILTDMVFENLGFEEEDYIKTPGLESNMQFRQKAENLAMMIQQEAMMMQQQMGMGGGMQGMIPGMF